MPLGVQPLVRKKERDINRNLPTKLRSHKRVIRSKTFINNSIIKNNQQSCCACKTMSILPQFLHEKAIKKFRLH